ncbi:zinc ribbon domain-containing protein [Leucobacter sp. HY1910]
MKASPRQQQLLLDLQDLDTLIAQHLRKRKLLPQRAAIAALAGELDGAKSVFMAAQRELDAHTAEFERVESDVELVAQRVKRDEQLLAVSTAPKEAQALTAELAQLAERSAKLEDKQLEIMELQEGAQAAFASATAALEGVDGRRAELQSALDDAEAAINRELAISKKERLGLSAELQRDLLDLYESLRGRIGIGAARLRGNVSEASNMALAPAELAGILEAAPDEVTFCPGTGAILVRVTAEADPAQ